MQCPPEDKVTGIIPANLLKNTTPAAPVNPIDDSDFNHVNHIEDSDSTRCQPLCQQECQQACCVRGVEINPTQKKLTQKEIEICNYLFAGKNQNQIADTLGTSRQNVNNYVNRLKKKGYVTFDNKPINYIDPTMSTPHVNPLETNFDDGTHLIRCHAQHWIIEIPKLLNWQNATKYNRKIGRYVKDDPKLDKNTVFYGRDTIQIYCTKKSFVDRDSASAFRKSLEYMRTFFPILEGEVHLELVRPGHDNIRLAYQSFSEVGNELAIECEMTRKKLKVYAQEDGKLCYEIDNSFNLKEFESKHPETSNEDMTKAQKHFNDIRKNDPPTNSELQKRIEKLEQGAPIHSIIESVKECFLGIPNEPKKCIISNCSHRAECTGGAVQ